MDNFQDLLDSLLDAADGPNAFDQVISSPLISFGPVAAPYALAEVFPEREVDDNVIDGVALRFQSIIANATDRYSPPQYKSAVAGVTIGAKLAESNAAFKIEAPLIDTINRMLRRGVEAQGAARIMQAFEMGTVKPLLDLAELWRAQCFVYAQVTAVGMSGRAEAIPYSNPASSRSNAAGTYSDNTYDPMPDIIAKQTLLASRGYRVARIIMGSDVLRILAANAKMQARGAAFRIIQQGAVNNVDVSNMPTSRLSSAQISAIFADEGLPPIQIADGTYNTTTQRGLFFWPRGTIGFVGATAQNENVVDQRGNLIRTLENVVGFTGIGTPAGQAAPGRVYRAVYEDKLPPYADFTSWQTMIPVLEQDEALAAIKNIS